jgi:agmatine/peptidylarginine deiminase
MIYHRNAFPGIVLQPLAVLLTILVALGIHGMIAADGSASARTSDEAASALEAAYRVDQDLPIGMTPAEETIKHLIGTFHRDTDPPPGPGIRQCAEWEPVTGGLVRYPFGLPYPILGEIAEDVELWVIVANSSQQNAAYNALNSQGVNMDNVRFIQAPTNSMWTRDYGPQFVFDGNGDHGIVDHHYNRPRPYDDEINYAVGAEWSIPVYGSPLIHTGGNYMCDGHNVGFSTNLIYNENPGLSEAEVDGYMYDYLGIEAYRVIPDIAPYGIHHIDCWAKLLDEETILVKEVPPGHSSYDELEDNVATMQTWTNAYGRPYKIVRVYCGYIGSGDVASYTNSLILNNKVFVPTFNISSDDDALQTYRDAMPGYEVSGHYYYGFISDDAIHCRCMGIHDEQMLRVDTAPLPDTVWCAMQDVRVDALIDDRSETGLDSDSLLVCWRVAGQPAFESVVMTAAAGPDSFYAYVPGQPIGTEVEYYVFAADNSDRRETRPPAAPAGYYTYLVQGDPAVVADGDLTGNVRLSANWPNPFCDGTTINFQLSSAERVSLAVIDAEGRRVVTLVRGDLPAGGHSARWDGRDDSGAEAANGIYFFRLAAGDQLDMRRGVLIR